MKYFNLILQSAIFLFNRKNIVVDNQIITFLILIQLGFENKLLLSLKKNKMKKLLFVLFLSVFFNLFSQIGKLDPTFNSTNGPDDIVRAFIKQSDGKIIVAVDFNYFDSIPRRKIARMHSNGSLDTTFKIGDGFNTNVNCVALQSDGKILVGGAFTSYNSSPCKQIVRLNQNGSLDTTFTPSSTIPNYK